MKKIIIYLFLSIGIIGCEDFLKEEPTSFINPVTFFKSRKDAEASVVAGYDYYGGFQTLTFGFWRDFFYEMLHDDFVHRPVGNVNNTKNNSLYTSFFSSDGNIAEAYSNHIEGINSFNVSIDGINKMEAFEGQEALISEARFLRAYSYFMLVRLFGRVPLLDKPLNADEVRNIPRSKTVEEVYDLIISDLEYASEKGWESAPLPGRATKWAAMSYLAKVHLTLENWNEAQTWAAKVIAESPHSLLNDYAAIFEDENENNAESIFELQMQLGDERSNQVGNWPRGIGRNGDKNYFLGPNWGGAYIGTDEFVNSFEDGDIRRTLIDTLYVRKDGTVIEFNADGEMPWYPLKRVSKAYLEGLEACNNSSYNFIAMRLAEVYLIAAEAENEANGPGSAYQYVNPVRLRAGLPELSGLSQEDFRQMVRDERRHELYDERNRYFDLKRWGILVERTLVAKPEAQIQEFHNLLPIPQRAMDRNPALVGDQNPGYTE